MVCVLPGILPATISVAPKSPSARANASTMPLTRPFLASGSVTVKLMGLDPSRNYRITNKDNGESIVKSGAELASGFDLRSDQPRSSLLLKYQAE